MANALPPSAELEPDTGFVRVSYTRLTIVRLITERPRTVGELARLLGINKSAVHRHVQRLVRDGTLMRAPAMTKKWVYYRLGPDATAAVAGSRRAVAALAVLVTPRP